MKRTDHQHRLLRHQTTTNNHNQHNHSTQSAPCTSPPCASGHHLIHSSQAGDIPVDTDTMKLSLVLISTCLAAVMAAPEVVEPALKLRGPGPEAVIEASDIVPRDADGVALFEKRGCDYNTGCRSIKNAKPGKYCGYCKQVAYNYPWIGSVSLP